MLLYTRTANLTCRRVHWSTRVYVSVLTHSINQCSHTHIYIYICTRIEVGRTPSQKRWKYHATAPTTTATPMMQPAVAADVAAQRASDTADQHPRTSSPSPTHPLARCPSRVPTPRGPSCPQKPYPHASRPRIAVPRVDREPAHAVSQPHLRTRCAQSACVPIPMTTPRAMLSGCRSKSRAADSPVPWQTPSCNHTRTRETTTQSARADGGQYAHSRLLITVYMQGFQPTLTTRLRPLQR